MSINLEHLFDGFGDDEPADDALIADKDDPVFELQRCCGRSTLHRFSGVLNLEQSSVGAECCDAVIVSSSTWLHGLTSVQWFG